MIDQATIERIHEAARIEDVVGDYVTLRRRGVNMIGLCPFHNEKTPSFTVSPAKGIFKCFGCGKGGNSVHFIMEHEQLSYVDALKYLAKKYHIEIVEKELTAEELQANNDRESMLLVNEFAQKYFTNTLHHHVEGKAVGLSYFHERGFRDDIIQKFQLGYCLDERDAFTKEALKAGYNKDFLVKTGLTIDYATSENGEKVPPVGGFRGADRFRGRVMFPVHSLSGKVLAFGGRVLKKDDKTAKYVNSPESEIYHKSNELYGIFFAKQAIVKHDRCYLVEGYTDVISMHQSGIENVVASSGTSLTPGQIRLIHRFTENVTVIYDGDPAGIKASIRGIDMLLEEGLNIKVLLLPDGDDPDSFARKHNSSDFIEFVEKNAADFIRFKTNLLLEDAGNDPIKKAKLVQDIVQSIAIIPNQIIRAEYVKECSTLLNVAENVLYHEISKIKTKEFEARINKKPEDEKKEETVSVKKTPETISITKFEKEERNIIRTLLKYGRNILFKDENGNTLCVDQYIFEELENDQLIFQNEKHRKLVEEYKNSFEENNFIAEKYFLNHPDYELSSLTADLISDKYVLSKIHSKFHQIETDDNRLNELAPRYIYEYKLVMILQKRKDKMLEMKAATEKSDETRTMELMSEIKQIDFFKSKLSEELDRVLNLL
ncbi:DNA primase [uncultured Paludibacter sp.]|nr:DNA primase [uncultured Paludibacter sp.]